VCVSLDFLSSNNNKKIFNKMHETIVSIVTFIILISFYFICFLVNFRAQLVSICCFHYFRYRCHYCLCFLVVVLIIIVRSVLPSLFYVFVFCRRRRRRRQHAICVGVAYTAKAAAELKANLTRGCQVSSAHSCRIHFLSLPHYYLLSLAFLLSCSL